MFVATLATGRAGSEGWSVILIILWISVSSSTCAAPSAVALAEAIS
jgi:hypothetical protein